MSRRIGCSAMNTPGADVTICRMIYNAEQNCFEQTVKGLCRLEKMPNLDGEVCVSISVCGILSV